MLPGNRRGWRTDPLVNEVYDIIHDHSPAGIAQYEMYSLLTVDGWDMHKVRLIITKLSNSGFIRKQSMVQRNVGEKYIAKWVVK